MSLLTIIQNATIRCNYTFPSTVFGNSDPVIQQFIAFSADATRDYSMRWDWRALKTSSEMIGDGVTTLWALPPDWRRLNPSDKSQTSAFVSNLYPLLPLQGPVNDEDLNQMKQYPSIPTRPLWRIIGASIEIWPALAVGEIVTFGYISTYFYLLADGVTKLAAWTADTNTCILDEDIVMKGTVWRWKAAKGLDYAEEMRAAEMAFDQTASQEGQERVVVMSRSVVSYGDNWWPGTITDLTNH